MNLLDPLDIGFDFGAIRQRNVQVAECRLGIVRELGRKE
jgi:hypothetical protein